MKLDYSAEHIFRFELDNSIAFRDHDVDLIRIEIMWVDAEGDQPEGWWIEAELRGWPLTTKGKRDKRQKARERIWAEQYPNALWSALSDAWTIALQRTGIDATQIVNPGEGLFDPAKWTEVSA